MVFNVSPFKNERVLLRRPIFLFTLQRQKKVCTPGDEAHMKIHLRNYFLVYQLISHFLTYLQNYKEFKAKILDLHPEKYGLSFDIKKYTTSG